MYEKILTVPPEGWTTADLFRELQTISGDAVEDIRLTGNDLKRIGLMWVIIRYDIHLERSFQAGETLRVVTWAGPLRHRISQRNYLIYDQSGRCVLHGAGNWAIADREKRCMVDAETYGLFFPSEVTGKEEPRPAAPEKLICTGSACYTVGEKDLDMNRHMNNTRYFDIAESMFLAGERVHRLRRVKAVFQNEALNGEKLSIHWGNRENLWYVCGDGNGKNCFQMSLEYAPGVKSDS